jgi:hypothetical protein
MQSRTLTITLNAENSAALKDYEFWTGESAEQIINLAFEEFMETFGEITVWDIARDTTALCNWQPNSARRHRIQFRSDSSSALACTNLEVRPC